MKDAFAWIQKVKDLATKNALGIISQNLRKLDSDRVTRIERILTPVTGSALGEPAIFYQLIKDENGVIAIQRPAFRIEGAFVIDDSVNQETNITPYYNHIRDNFTDRIGRATVHFQGDIVTGVDALGETQINLDNYGTAVDTIAQGNDSRFLKANKLIETSGPTEMPIGAVADGEFLKRVGGNIVGGAAGGGSTPTGTGFRHVVAGVEDAAAKLVDTADINDDQVTFAKFQNIGASKLVGRGGGAGAGDATELGVISPIAISGGNVSLDVVSIGFGGTGQTVRQDAIDALTDVAGATNEHVLTKDTATGNAKFKAVPAGGSHASTHENGGADEVNVAGLSGLLADQQTPLTHDILTKHNGFPGGTTNFLRADGTFAAPPGGGSLSYLEFDRGTDLALTTTWTTATNLSLTAGTWLILGQTSIESTSTTQANVAIRLRNTDDNVTYSIAEAEFDSALPDRGNLFVHAVVVLAATKNVALQGWAQASTAHMIGPGNLGSELGTKVTRITAVKIA